MTKKSEIFIRSQSTTEVQMRKFVKYFDGDGKWILPSKILSET